MQSVAIGVMVAEMGYSDHPSHVGVMRLEGSSFELRGDAANAVGLVRDATERGAVRVRTEDPPSFSTTQLGRTSVSRLAMGSFDAVLTDTRRSSGNAWLNILMQTEGSTRFENDDHCGESTPGQLVIFDSNKETAIGSESRSERVVASIPKSALPTPIMKRLDKFVHVIEPAPGLPRIFSAFLRATSRDAAVLGQAERGRMGRTLLYLASDILEIFGDAPATEAARTLTEIRATALHIIETDINGLTTTAELADRISCSERYLFLAFRQAGLSPARHIQSVRMRRARIAIESHSDVSITEIAYAAGFQSYSHFSRLFRQTYGVTPRSLRAGEASVAVSTELS